MFAGGMSRGKYIEFIYYPFVPPLHASADKRTEEREGEEGGWRMAGCIYYPGEAAIS